jgi:hypothetical protein
MLLKPNEMMFCQKQWNQLQFINLISYKAFLIPQPKYRMKFLLKPLKS